MKLVSNATLVVLFFLAISLALPTRAQDAADDAAILFQNVRIFDGKSDRLSAPSNVLVRGNGIERISAGPITVEGNARIIEGGGRTLMPGLIDNHWHATAKAINESSTRISRN